MNGTVNVLCFKSKTLANGEHPLMVCISKDGKRKYKSLGVSVLPQYWDFEKNKPKRSCPNKELITKLINTKIKEYSEYILELKATNKNYTASKLIEKVNGVSSKSTVGELFDSHISQLLKEGRLKYASTYKELKSSLIGFNRNLDIYFSDIDTNWLREYEAYLRSKKLAENSIGVRFRTLRAIYNLAIEKEIVRQEYYPFKQYKVSKLSKETAKRSITKTDIEKIINHQADSDYKKFAIHIFYFSYLCAGINFKDIAYLTRNNIVDNRLVYTRKKTKKLIKIPLQPKALEIILEYDKKNRDYLFPILSKVHKTDVQQANRLHKVMAKVNRELKVIGKELKLPIDLTTYVARHSYSTILKRSGVSTSIISESLGHSSEKITKIYLDSFENEQLSDAMVHLL